MDAKTLIFATSNKGKVEEAREIARALGAPFQLLSLDDAAGDSRTVPPAPDESGATYLENTLIKARFYHRWSGLPVIADDAGLEVAALRGAPGIYTARYAGEGATSAQNIERLLNELRDAPDRSARFVCCLAVVGLRPAPVSVTGMLDGRISREPSGAGGFGYDPVFEIDTEDGASGTLAELKQLGVTVRTHRYRAFEALVAALA